MDVKNTGRRGGARARDGRRRGGARGTGKNSRRSAAQNDASIRAVFLRRMRSWTQDLAENVPVSVLADALAHPSARGSMVHVLSEVGPEVEESEAGRLRRRAMERALAAREELREQAGGFGSTAWVAEHLKVSRQSVDKRRAAGKLLAIRTSSGSYEYPLCQFTADGAVPGLEDVLGVLDPESSSWERLVALVSSTPALEGRSAVQALQEARSEQQRERVVADRKSVV